MMLRRTFLILLLFISFYGSLLAKHGRSNPYEVLGNYMNTRLYLLSFESPNIFMTLKSGVVRRNRVQSITVEDTIEWSTFKRMVFDSLGRLVRLNTQEYASDMDYVFHYDSLLAVHGIQRISIVQYPTSSFEDSIVYEMTYDNFGNVTSRRNKYDSLSEVKFSYRSTFRYQYVLQTSWSRGYEFNEVYKYDKRTGKLFHSEYVGPFEYIGMLTPDKDIYIRDTIRYNYPIDCLDTIPDGRYFRVRSSEQGRAYYSIERDSMERVTLVAAEFFKSWKITYGSNGLPESYVLLENSDGRTTSRQLCIKYTYW